MSTFNSVLQSTTFKDTTILAGGVIFVAQLHQSNYVPLPWTLYQLASCVTDLFSCVPGAWVYWGRICGLLCVLIWTSSYMN